MVSDLLAGSRFRHIGRVSLGTGITGLELARDSSCYVLHSRDSLVEYLKQLYAADKLAKAIKGGPTRSKDSKRPSDSSDKNGRPRKRQRGGTNKSDRTKACVHCGKWHPSPDHECWHKDGNKKDSPSRDEKKNENNKWKRQYKQFANYMETQEKKKE